MKMFDKYFTTLLLNNLTAACLTALLVLLLSLHNPFKIIEIKKNHLVELSIDWKESISAKAPIEKVKKFAETNPAAQDNIPDKTNLFSSKNQQAAQPDFNTDPKKRAFCQEHKVTLET